MAAQPEPSPAREPREPREPPPPGRPPGRRQRHTKGRGEEIAPPRAPERVPGRPRQALARPLLARESQTPALQARPRLSQRAAPPPQRPLLAQEPHPRPNYTNLSPTRQPRLSQRTAPPPRRPLQTRGVHTPSPCPSQRGAPPILARLSPMEPPAPADAPQSDPIESGFRKAPPSSGWLGQGIEPIRRCWPGVRPFVTEAGTPPGGPGAWPLVPQHAPCRRSLRPPSSERAWRNPRLARLVPEGSPRCSWHQGGGDGAHHCGRALSLPCDSSLKPWGSSARQLRDWQENLHFWTLDSKCIRDFLGIGSSQGRESPSTNESHQDFQNLKAKFQSLQAGFGELPKKPPLPKGSQLPGLGRANTISESSSPSGAPAANQRGPPWPGQGTPPSPWLRNRGRGSQASSRTREAPRDQQPPWRVTGNDGEKASSLPSPTPLGSPRTPRKEQGLSFPRRRPLPPLKALGPQPPKPPLPPGTLHLERFRRKEATHRRATGKKTILGVGTKVTALQKPGSFSSNNCLGPPGPPIPQNSWKPSEESKKEEISKAPKPPKPPKHYKKEEKAEKEFRKKFKFEGDIVTLTRMMIDPNANTRRGGGRNLAIRRGEILDVIQFTSREQILCRDVSGKYGFIPRRALLPLETEVYDDVSF
ncbi:PML-RARA-regulated adapter molecule 1 [Trichosurus vulpecula]|uniref:PML-RARA-regulated adapter molecule 1 n=1 Tax=Trichosurus vulpecula TaxID=9337 RepID=UPI00186B0072|nr:PML-RARA-regulated adapter molecule 1 [Trichosurus vulpecula]